MTTDEHQPVLTADVLEGLAIIPDGKYIDATFGRGGHSREILKQLGSQGSLLAIDQDPTAVAVGESESFATDQRFMMKAASFRQLQHLAQQQGWLGQVNGILLDLGVSSPQLDNPARGFSFRHAGPLDMRMNPNQPLSAASWLQRAPVDDITKVLKEYGEERFARRIARAIVETRQTQPLTTTTELADLVAAAIPFREPNKHPATRTFQAIRIFINQELEALRDVLTQCLDVLAIGGRLVVISFHSLEDRIVKQFMQQEARGDAPPKLPLRADQMKQRLRIVSRLIRPTSIDIDHNPRARSARLRIAEKQA